MKLYSMFVCFPPVCCLFPTRIQVLWENGSCLLFPCLGNTSISKIVPAGSRCSIIIYWMKWIGIINWNMKERLFLSLFRVIWYSIICCHSQDYFGLLSLNSVNVSIPVSWKIILKKKIDFDLKTSLYFVLLSKVLFWLYN